MRARLIEDHNFLEKKKRHEEAASDLFTQIIRGAGKDLWFLEAPLQK
jgi:DNA-binding ferritin-like protein